MPLFSVVVPTCNRPELLGRCLEALRPGVQTFISPYEIIVTDDGTPTTELVATTFPWARWTRGPQRGPAANRNHGARQATGEWLVFLDDDCIPDGGCLASYAKALGEHPDCRAFEGAIRADGDMSLDMADCPVNEKGGVFWSANVCLERKLFEELGGFDEAFLLPAHEDQDLFLRVKPHTRVPFVRGAAVTHPVRRFPLRKLLREIDRRNSTLNYFVTKNAAALNYSSKAGIVAASYLAHLRLGYWSARRRHPKKLVYHAVMLLGGVPMQGLRLLFGPSLRKRGA